MAGRVPTYYWDACVWITLISEPGTVRHACCVHVLEMAQRGVCEIWTSSFTLAEVYKRKCDGIQVGIEEQYDQKFEDLIESEVIKKVSVDMDVGQVARRLLRRFPKIGKPQDAIHVATCLIENVDELHTFDRSDLLALDGQLDRLDRVKLRICQPPYPLPPSPQMEMPLVPPSQKPEPA